MRPLCITWEPSTWTCIIHAKYAPTVHGMHNGLMGAHNHAPRSSSRCCSPPIMSSTIYVWPFLCAIGDHAIQHHVVNGDHLTHQPWAMWEWLRPPHGQPVLSITCSDPWPRKLCTPCTLRAKEMHANRDPHTRHSWVEHNHRPPLDTSKFSSADMVTIVNGNFTLEENRCTQHAPSHFTQKRATTRRLCLSIHKIVGPPPIAS